MYFYKKRFKNNYWQCGKIGFIMTYKTNFYEWKIGWRVREIPRWGAEGANCNSLLQWNFQAKKTVLGQYSEELKCSTVGATAYGWNLSG